ncbi:MFS transporter [Herbidospora sp. NEAU-GS84]|uniref:MFS transporter n=1 Tax=Herbidospora solisilvae TaxID=2696284 RepID=A0A7C9NRI4_9ACTN|nr:MFS transporter [Herbidospora solisilvae]NAS25636.1 MFS transporter [Herbidospora solisilvae]
MSVLTQRRGDDGLPPLLTDPPRRLQGRGRPAPSSHKRKTTYLPVIVCAGIMGITMADTLAATLGVPQLAESGFGPKSPIDVQWLLTAFALPYAALLPVGGRLADVFGPRRLLTIGLSLFSLAAFCTVVTPMWSLLLAARAAQGLGAALMVPASLAMLLATVPTTRRAAAIGVWSASTGVAGTLMYALGGWFSQNMEIGWRVLFVPSAFLTLLLLTLSMTLPRPPHTRGAVPDIIGCLLLGAALAMLTWAIVQFPRRGWDPYVIGAVSGGTLMLLATMARSAYHKAPAIDLGLWRKGRFALAGTLSALYGLVSLPILVIMPLFLGQAMFRSPELIGAAIAPNAAGVLVGSVAAGGLIKRRGPRVVIYLGAVVIAGSCIGLLQLVIGTGRPLDVLQVWLPLNAALGLGFGLLNAGSSAAAALTAGPERYATAVGATMSVRQVGGTIGIAVTVVLLERPLVEAPMPGYTSVILGSLALAVFAGCLGLFFGATKPPAPARSAKRTPNRPETRPAPRPEPRQTSRPAPRPDRPVARTPVHPPIPLPRRAVPMSTPMSAPLSAPVEDEVAAEMLRTLKETTNRINLIADVLLDQQRPTR